MRWIRLAPMTAESLIVCTALYVGCWVQAASLHHRFSDVQREWGAIKSLELADVHDGVQRHRELELHGPFDIWDGEIWRIPVTVLHHPDLMNLVLCAGAAWYLGRRLERRWGSLGMGLFLVPAVCLPVLVELCCGQAYQGLSGTVCAMLGALVVLRHYDARTARLFTEEAAEIGVALIVCGWLATLCEIVSLPNIAHVTGFIYGASIAWVIAGPFCSVKLLRVSVVLIHFWLIPMLFLVTHPFWNGNYYWYQAVNARNAGRAERNLERATICDPTLVGAWLRWSQSAEDRGDTREAWRRLLDGLDHNPGSASLIDATRRLWRHLNNAGRRDAELVLNRVFGQRAAVWLRQLRHENTEHPGSNDDNGLFPDKIEAGDFPLDQKIELPSMDGPFNPQKPKAPVLQNDASAGETL